MGKSPGKWIKGLFRKKASQSETSKGRVLSKSASERPVRRSSKEQPITPSPPGQPVISDPVPDTITAKDFDETPKVMSDEVLKIPDPCLEKDKLDEAVLNLQAFVRGHLVRRQCVATLYSVRGIIKFQALARGYIVRKKRNTGAERSRGKSQVAKDPMCSEITVDVQASGLLKNAFVYKLCGGSSPPVTPLRLEYDQGDPNSAWNWMIRWSKLQVLAFDSKLNETHAVKHEAAEIESFETIITNDHEEQNLTPNTENHSARASESPKKENGLCETETAEHGQKLIEKPALEASAEETLKPLSKVSESSTMENDDDDDDEKLGRAQQISGNKNPVSNLSSEVHHLVDPVGDKSTNDNELTVNDKEEFKDDIQSSIVISKKSSRRASLPAKHDGLMTPEITAKVPSYMATTASSKAKAKAQVLSSPRLGVDRKSFERRLSLPSSVNVVNKTSSSPRVQANNRREETIKIDRSLSSSRDAAGKMMQVDWKR